MEVPKELYEIPLKLVMETEEKNLMTTPPTFEEFRNSLVKAYAISRYTKIDYMDDYGEFEEITSENSYQQALLSTNGMSHYFYVRALSAIDPEPTNPTSPVKWTCICHYVNESDAEKCKICPRKRKK